MKIYFILLLACLSFVIGVSKIDLDIVDEGDAVFASSFRQPTIPLEKNKKPLTDQEKKLKLSWKELSPEGKVKEYKIKSLPRKSRDILEEQSVVATGVIIHDLTEPTENDTVDEQKRFIFSPDTRVRVWDTTVFPYKVAGLLTFNLGYCTGTLISPRVVLTAGHCVHAGAGGGWYNNHKFYPGQNSAPTASTPYFTGYAIVSSGWANDGDFDEDWAVVVLSTSNTGKGWMSMGWSSSIASGWVMNDNGYPGDKSYGTQWHSSGAIADVESLVFRDRVIDLYKGNSGTGTYAYWSSTNTRIIYGIMSADVTENYFDWGCFCIKTRYWNQHVRINSDRFDVICNIINDPNVC